MLPSPALVVRLPANTTPAFRDRLSGVLAEHDLVAIQEDAINEPSLWTAHFAGDGARDAAAAALKADPEFAQLGIQAIEVEDEDWARRTQADLPAVRIGRIIVAPPWDVPAFGDAAGNPNSAQLPPSIPPRTPDADIVVLIEPSRGFGTGHHQSTRLCLVLLQNRNLSGLTVTDVGTGSGVLAIAAAKLGASFVNAIDSDPDAIENARENIAANGVERVVEAHLADLTTTTVSRTELVIANLTGGLLSRHAADLERLVRPGGSIIVSGFNVDERERVTQAMQAFFDVTEAAEEDDWQAFVFRASGSPRLGGSR